MIPIFNCHLCLLLIITFLDNTLPNACNLVVVLKKTLYYRHTTYQCTGPEKHISNLFDDLSRGTVICCLLSKWYCVVPEIKISTLPQWRDFLVWVPWPPFWKFYLRLILSFKNFGLWDPSPSPSEFPATLCDGGMDIFWNHTLSLTLHWKIKYFYFV